MWKVNRAKSVVARTQATLDSTAGNDLNIIVECLTPAIAHTWDDMDGKRSISGSQSGNIELKA